MTTGSKFETLVNAISENASYRLNANGIQLIKTYHSIIASLESSITPILQNITRDPIKMSKQAAVQIVSSVNSSKEGNENFDLMARLDTLTNGGKTPISGSSFTFNSNDKILQYLENI